MSLRFYAKTRLLSVLYPVPHDGEGNVSQMKFSMAGKTLAKTLLALNGASFIRALRFGPRAGARSLQAAYHAIDPLSAKENSTEAVLLKKIPEVTPEQAYISPEEFRLDLRFADISGSTPINDLLAFVALAVQQHPAAVLEFGTFWGSTTLNLAKNLPDAVIHTIDLPPDDDEAMRLTTDKPVDDLHLIANRQLGQAFRQSPVGERIVQHGGDTATYDYSGITHPVSFFLVDGSHTYEYAKSDTLVALSLASGRSTLVWHDCDAIHPGVTRWLGELIDAGLPVQRIAGTVVAFLRFDAADERVKAVLAR